jgi:hypothetical protein
MADNPLTNYYQPAQGSLVGFDGGVLDNVDPTLAKSGWSIEQIRRFLLNESGSNFPTIERVDEIEELILRHINDTNNPHNVSTTAITQDVTNNILSGFVPGTPPASTPFFAYDAACPIPMDSVYPATYSSTNFYRTVEGGRLVNPATEVDKLHIDATNGVAGLPLYSGLSNIVPSNWPTSAGLMVNTRVTKVTNDTIDYPFDFYRVDETNATGDFGVSIPASMMASNVYTFTIFLQPLYAGGYFAIKQVGNDAAVMLINSDTGDFVLGSTSVQGDVTVYPSGVMKVSYTFVASTGGSNRVQVLHRQTMGSEASRIGRNGQILFMMGLPLVSTSPIGTPLPVNTAAAASATALTPKLNTLGVPATLSRFMVSMSLIFRKQLGALPITDTVLFQFGGLALTRDATKVYLKLDGVTLFTSTITNGLNAFSVSYSPTEILFKDIAANKQKVTGSYAALSTTNVKVGPCAGHLRQFLLYPEQDSSKHLEFLTNG